MQELIIQVDKNDNIIGHRPKEDFRNSQFIHRSSQLYLFNSNGEMLIQKRSPKKKLYPNLLDASVSGTVRKDEAYEQTLKREMKEELGISEPFEFLFKFSHFDKFDKAIKKVFTAKYNSDFKLQEDEVKEVFWISVEKLKKSITKNPKKFCGPLLTGLQVYFTKTTKL